MLRLLSSFVLALVASLVPFEALACTCDDPASPCAALTVDAAAPAGGDCVTAACSRITDALARARWLRAGDRCGAAGACTPIKVCVAPGAYRGTFSAQAASRGLETLPLVIDIPNFTLAGATVLERDGEGLAMVAEPTVATSIESVEPLGFQQTLILVAPTSLLPTPGKLDGPVTISGLVLDGHADNGKSFFASGIRLQRVAGFSVKGNLVRNQWLGVYSVASSGSVAGNLLLSNRHEGLTLTGGSRHADASSVVSNDAVIEATKNRILHNLVAGMVMIVSSPSADNVPDMGVTGLQLGAWEETEPLPIFATVTGNDIGYSLYAGVGLLAWGFYANLNATSPALGAPLPAGFDPRAGHLAPRAVFRGNRINKNRDYGIWFGNGFNFRDGNSLTINAVFSGNDLSGNGRAPALFDFGLLFDTLAGAPPSFPLLRNSTWDLTDEDGALAGFDFNFVAGQGNRFFLNNRLLPDGRQISRSGPR